MKRSYLVEITSENECPDEHEFLKAVLGGFCDGYFGDGASEIKVKKIIAKEQIWRKIEGTDKWESYTI